MHILYLTPGVDHSSPKVVLDRTAVPYAQKDPRFLFKISRGALLSQWSLDNTDIHVHVHELRLTKECDHCPGRPGWHPPLVGSVSDTRVVRPVRTEST